MPLWQPGSQVGLTLTYKLLFMNGRDRMCGFSSCRRPNSASRVWLISTHCLLLSVRSTWVSAVLSSSQTPNFSLNWTDTPLLLEDWETEGHGKWWWWCHVPGGMGGTSVSTHVGTDVEDHHKRWAQTCQILGTLARAPNYQWPWHWLLCLKWWTDPKVTLSDILPPGVHTFA